MKRRNREEALGRIRELEVDGRLPMGRPKKWWRKNVEDLTKLNIVEDNVYDRKRRERAISNV